MGIGGGFGGYGGGYGGDFGYQPDIGSAGGAEEILGAVFAVIGGIFLIFLAFAILSYVLQSLALYNIAKRRMIANPWLAWVPYGSNWILGSISDQYQYVAKGKIRNRRKILLGLTIATGASGMIYEIVGLFAGVSAALDTTGYGAIGWALGMLIFALVMLVVSIVMTVYYYVALYDLYTSCDPDNNLTYLLLSIFLGITLPFLLFACRKHDKGMPPRKTQVEALPQQAAPQTEAQPAAEEPAPVEEPEAPAPAQEPAPAPETPEE